MSESITRPAREEQAELAFQRVTIPGRMVNDRHQALERLGAGS
jgi:hypothetical protein